MRQNLINLITIFKERINEAFISWIMNISSIYYCFNLLNDEKTSTGISTEDFFKLKETYNQIIDLGKLWRFETHEELNRRLLNEILE